MSDVKAACMDCDVAYSDFGFVDLVVPDHIWRAIAPQDGLLCPTCLCRRVSMAGFHEVPAEFRSGPFVRSSPSREEGIEEAACECVTCGRMHRRLGEPPWAITHAELCSLSRAWGKHTDYRTSSDVRVNEWLKKQIAAIRALTAKTMTKE